MKLNFRGWKFYKVLLSTSFDNPLYRYETLRYLSSTVYLKPDSKRMREIFYIIFFFPFPYIQKRMPCFH